MNGKAIGTTTSAPYSVNWVPTANGTYTVQATAIDQNTGKKGSSDKETVTVTTILGRKLTPLRTFVPFAISWQKADPLVSTVKAPA